MATTRRRRRPGMAMRRKRLICRLNLQVYQPATGLIPGLANDCFVTAKRHSPVPALVFAVALCASAGAQAAVACQARALGGAAVALARRRRRPSPAALAGQLVRPNVHADLLPVGDHVEQQLPVAAAAATA